MAAGEKQQQRKRTRKRPIEQQRWETFELQMVSDPWGEEARCSDDYEEDKEFCSLPSADELAYEMEQIGVGVEPSAYPPPRGVFCTRTLDLREVKVIGYDMDYTLIDYRCVRGREHKPARLPRDTR